VPTAAYKRRPRHTPSGLELPRTDGRTLAARRFRGLCEAFETELGGGQLSETERGMVRQAAGLQLRLEQLQGEIVEGRDVNADEIIRLSSEHRRVLSALRLKGAKNKPAGPTLQDYLAARYGSAPAEATEVDDAS
jgi:hypothetical protein